MKELKRHPLQLPAIQRQAPYSVPDLYDDMLNTFNKKKNAAFEFCEAEYFLAYQDNKIVGRVAAIINHKANKTWDKKNVRFGWIDFIDNPEVSDALIHTVEELGKRTWNDSHTRPIGLHRLRCGRHADRRLRSTQHHGNHLQLSLLSATHGAYGIWEGS